MHYIPTRLILTGTFVLCRTICDIVTNPVLGRLWFPTGIEHRPFFLFSFLERRLAYLTLARRVHVLTFVLCRAICDKITNPILGRLLFSTGIEYRPFLVFLSGKTVGIFKCSLKQLMSPSFDFRFGR